MKQKVRIIVVVLGLAWLTLPLFSEVRGYLSFSYTKGQEFSPFPGGIFQDGPLGLTFSGSLAPKIEYSVELRITDLTEIGVEQAWLGMAPSGSFRLRLGLYLVPFGIYNENNRPYQTLLVNPPLAVAALYPESWRDIGVRLEGTLSVFEYDLYVGNGLAEGRDLSSGQQFKDNNSSKGLGGRAGLSLSRNLAVGYSLYRGKHDDDNSRFTTLQAGHVRWITEDIHISAEYDRARIENPEGFSSGEGEGYFIQAGFEMGEIQPVFCYQTLKYKDVFHGLEIGEETGIDMNRRRWTLGFVYRISTQAFLKFEYDFNRESDVQIDNDAFIIEMALNWDLP